ncbi:MAG: HAD hydrolase-like protein, partial [Pseudomonadales bacterium]|nr:HAD hydrolase-like protein [Pseudomonadales bacterium]
HALAQINAQPESCIHVGDHIIDDIQGAAESGIKTIWFNWQNQSQNVDVQPDRIITELRELPQAIASLAD